MEKLIFVVYYVNQFKISMDMQDNVTEAESIVLANSLDQFLDYFRSNYNQGCYSYELAKVQPTMLPLNDLTCPINKRQSNGKR